MDELDFIRDVKGSLPLEHVTTACARAFAEYQNCMAHDEEIVVPPNLPEEVHRRLDHGRKLALKRAHLIHDTLSDTLAHLAIRALPPEYQRFHPSYMTEIAPEELDKVMRDNGLER